jgi:VanZ family protein
MESTNGLGATQTNVWLTHLLASSGHQAAAHQGAFVALINHILRKGGHFMGYGLLGVLFARGWFALLRRRIVSSWSGLRLRAGALGVASIFVVGGCDEIHQTFLPTRGACFSDVLLDTCGALTLNLLFFAVIAYRRRALTNPAEGSLITLQLSLADVAGMPSRVSNSANVQRLVRRSSAGVAKLNRRRKATRTVHARSIDVHP